MTINIHEYKNLQKRLSLITPAIFDDKKSLDSIFNDAQIQPKKSSNNLRHLKVKLR